MPDDISNLFGLDSMAQPAPGGGDPFSAMVGMAPAPAPVKDKDKQPQQQEFKTPRMRDLEAQSMANLQSQQALQQSLQQGIQIKQPNPQDEQNYVNQTWAINRYNPANSGAAGKATTFLSDLLRGMRGQSSIRDSIENAARADYQKQYQDQVQAAQFKRQQDLAQMTGLKNEQGNINQQMTQERYQNQIAQKDYLGQINLLKGQNWRQALASDVNNLPKGYASQQIMNPTTGQLETWIGPAMMKMTDVSDLDPKDVSAVFGDNFDLDKPRSVQDVNEIRGAVSGYKKQQAQIQAQKDMETQREAARQKLQDQIDDARKQIEQMRTQKQDNSNSALLVDPSGVLRRAGVGTNVSGYVTPQQFGSTNNPTQQMRNAAASAELVHNKVPEVLNEIDQLKDKMGPVAGRWDKFMQGKIGMDDPDFAGLRADLMLLSSQVALMHARGRLPENLREEFEQAINAPQQTPGNLKAIINKADSWAQDNIKLGQSPSQRNSSPKPSFNSDDARKKYNY